MRIRRKNNVTILSSSEILYFLKHGIPFQKPVIHDKHSGEGVLILIRELMQQRRRRLGKSFLKSEVSLLQTLSRLFHMVQFAKYWQYFLKLGSKDCIEVQERIKKVVVLSSCPP